MHNSARRGNIPVMTPRLRTLLDHVARPAEPDAVLLRRFADARDPAAFAELVRRYGRLVWGQCRNLLSREADADDAFQATFLTLAKSAKVIRDTNKLGPWLHGVAYHVCQQVHRTATRRAKREKATAKAEATRPVADSAWDQAFAAVHAELAQLPDTLRAPFILCVLEGKGTTEAAEQLGLKLGTFSARLSRAKQTLFERLSARGLTAGLAAVGAVAVGASSVPAAVAAKACDLAAGGTVPANILSLSHGVLGMATLNAKRWVMAAVIGCGLAFGGVGTWTANGQDNKPAPKPMPSAEEQLKQLRAAAEAKRWEAERAADALKRAQVDAEKATVEAEKAAVEAELPPLPPKVDGPSRVLAPKVVWSPQPEFKYVAPQLITGFTQKEFEGYVKQLERDGWQFVGSVSILPPSAKRNDPAEPTLVFRRVQRADPVPPRTIESGGATDRPKAEPKPKPAVLPPAVDEEKTLQSEIERLTKQLHDLRTKEKAAPREVAVFKLADLGVADLDFTAAAQLLSGIVRLRFGDEALKHLSITQTGKSEVTVQAGDDAGNMPVRWLTGQVNELRGMAPAKPGGR